MNRSEKLAVWLEDRSATFLWESKTPAGLAEVTAGDQIKAVEMTDMWWDIPWPFLCTDCETKFNPEGDTEFT